MNDDAPQQHSPLPAWIPIVTVLFLAASSMGGMFTWFNGEMGANGKERTALSHRVTVLEGNAISTADRMVWGSSAAVTQYRLSQLEAKKK